MGSSGQDETDPLNEKEDWVRGLRAEMFEKGTFPGMDALVALIPQGQEIPSEIKRALDEAGTGRWFPFEGGWKVVCPYDGQDFDPSLFSIEEGAWTHEHCDGCETTVNVGDSCWVAEEDDECFLLCDDCYGRLKAHGRPN